MVQEMCPAAPAKPLPPLRCGEQRTHSVGCIGHLSLCNGRMPGPVCPLLNIIYTSRIGMMKRESLIAMPVHFKGPCPRMAGERLGGDPMETQSSPRYSPQICSHFQNASKAAT